MKKTVIAKCCLSRLTIRVQVLLLVFAVLGITLYSCQKEDDDYNYSPEIVNSLEFQEFIIAGADIKHSLAIFEKEISKVDFSNLETVIDPNGNKIEYLPAVIRELNIEQKILRVNQLKEALICKYPKLASLSPNNFDMYVKKCVEQSTEVNTSLLNKDINIYQPLTKEIISEFYCGNTGEMSRYLQSWIGTPGYVEVAIFMYADGSAYVVIDNRNTNNEFKVQYTQIGNAYYYEGRQFVTFAHTHLSSGYPSGADLRYREGMLYCAHAIYYSGAFYYF